MRRFFFVLVLWSCRPDLDDRPTMVTTPRVLAVVAEPPEAFPGERVKYDVYVGTGSGPAAAPQAFWAYCVAPKALGENNTVSGECLTNALLPVGGPSPRLETSLPSDACRLFGPDTPPGGFRPRDPDPTGGYYQPLRINIDGDLAMALHRIRCNLAGAPAALARAYGERYRANKNPRLEPITATLDGMPVPFDQLPAGRAVVLRTRWLPEDVERFVTLDIAAQSLVERGESMRVSWFATAGSFESDRTGRSEDEPDTTTANTWTLPPTAGPQHVWAVLRDSRGGSAIASAPVVVR